jgi:hypothetical protein
VSEGFLDARYWLWVRTVMGRLKISETAERRAREEMDREDIEDARAALQEAEEKGTVPLRDLMRELAD